MQDIDIEKYRALTYKRWEEEQMKLDLRFSKALEKSHKASLYLKEKYKAENVIAFGSINRKNDFNFSSDIDLAVSGINEKDYLFAVSGLIDLIPEFKIDLIRLEDVSEKFKKYIFDDGLKI
jgi:uncharacterized protein